MTRELLQWRKGDGRKEMNSSDVMESNNEYLCNSILGICVVPKYTAIWQLTFFGQEIDAADWLLDL